MSTSDDPLEQLPAPCSDADCACHASAGISRSALRLEYLTIGYNVIEAVLSVGVGIYGSVLALLAFGLDSVIEVSASVILVWRLQAQAPPEKMERFEKRAQRLVAVSFFALGAMIAYEAATDLVSHSAPEKTVLGLIIAIASSIVMPILGKAKRRRAVALAMPSLASESAQTSICGYLSLILLASLVLYRVFGWWWADAVGALAMLPIIVREGFDSWRGKTCCC